MLGAAPGAAYGHVVSALGGYAPAVDMMRAQAAFGPLASVAPTHGSFRGSAHNQPNFIGLARSPVGLAAPGIPAFASAPPPSAPERSLVAAAGP